MKIAYDWQIFYWQNYGGISRYFCEIATRIARFDEVKIIGGIYVNQYLVNCPSNLRLGFYLPVIPNTWKFRQIYNTQLCRWWFRTNCPDIVHETYYSTKRQAPKNTKVVITVYDMLYEKFSNLPGANKICTTKLEAIKRADRVICISENTRRDLLEVVDIDPEKVSVVYLGTSFASDIYRQFSSQQSYYPYILYVGNRSYYKNFDRFLKAYATSSVKCDFKLICFGGGAFSPEELKLIENLGIPKNQVIQLSGEDRDLANIYSHASAFVYPSLYEGFGIPLLEAMSCCCPVICSNTSSMPEVAGDAAEFFDPYEPESIVQALEKVLYSSERSKNLVKLGQERLKHFSWDKCAEQTRSIYLSLM